MEELIGISLSQEELLAAILIAGLPTPVGYDDLEGRVFGDLPSAVRVPLLAAAERSLLAHGLVELRESETLLVAPLRELLEVCIHPERSWLVLHQPAGQPQRVSYFHQRAGRMLAHVELVAIHQFVQLSGAPDLQATVLELVAPAPDSEVPPLQATLPEPTFATLVAAPPADSATLRRQLNEAGWDVTMIEAFAMTIEQLVGVTACARFVYAEQPPLQRAFTIVHGAGMCWIARLSGPGLVELKRVGAQSLARGLQDFAQGA